MKLAIVGPSIFDSTIFISPLAVSHFLYLELLDPKQFVLLVRKDQRN